ncbi:MAG TPA: exosortase K, partial [Blastocatellia bacterium]|nr:exosortase K [Blastocatellia bacterium]
ADQLRWILAPTTACVELVTGASFEFESHAGYLSEDRSFLIANSCAGVNFMITAFLMFSGRRLLSGWSKEVSWKLIPAAALIAYPATIIANTTRIAVALELQPMSVEMGWLNRSQFHRFEGIVIYFGFLLLLFLVDERTSSGRTQSLLRRSLFPLIVYYAAVLGIPAANGAYRQGPHFWEHLSYVLLVPPLLILPLVTLGLVQEIMARRLASSPCSPKHRD